MDANGFPKAFDVTEVQISALAHATEDEDKVERAVRNIIPMGIAGVTMDRKRLSGYYKDPITLITTQIKKKKEAAEMFQVTIGNLSTLDQQRLLEEVEDRVDETGGLYLRFDKQRAFKSLWVLKEFDPIRMRFRFRIPHGSDPVSFIRSSVTAVIDEVDKQSLKNKGKHHR